MNKRLPEIVFGQTAISSGQQTKTGYFFVQDRKKPYA